MDYNPPDLCPWDFSGKNTGLGCHFLFWVISQPRDWTHIFCVSSIGRWILLPLHYLGSLSPWLLIPKGVNRLLWKILWFNKTSMTIFALNVIVKYIKLFISTNNGGSNELSLSYYCLLFYGLFNTNHWLGTCYVIMAYFQIISEIWGNLFIHKCVCLCNIVWHFSLFSIYIHTLIY